MHIEAIDLHDRRQVNTFLRLPFYIYANISQWIPPLIMDARRQLNPNKNPFFEYGDAVFLLAFDRNRPAGRLAVLNNRGYNHYNQEATAFFYLFECDQNPDAAAGLFEIGCEWARKQGATQIIGPKGFTPFDGLGMLVKGYDHRPAFGQPYNPPYYSKLIEDLGFENHRELVSGFLDSSIQFPQKIFHVADLLLKRRGLHIARYKTRRELRSLIPHLRGLYNGALAGSEGTVPITEGDVKGIADQMLWFADPSLIKIVMKDDEPVGFLLAYPDISAALQRTKGRLFPFGWIDLWRELHQTKWININGAGMKDGYRGLGGTALLFSEMYKSVVESRYRYAEVVQIGVENQNMQREMRDLGIDFYKAHRLYRRDL